MMMVMKIIGVLVLSGVLMWTELAVLKKKNKRKDIIVFSVLMIAVTGFTVVKMMSNFSSNLAYLIAWFYKPLSDLIRLLQ